MRRSEHPLTLSDGKPVVMPGRQHSCYFPTGWNQQYSHSTVAVILTDRKGNIALVKRREDQAAEGGKFALPGGYVEFGQTLANAAETEVREETGHLIVPKTLGMFAIMDGPNTLPGRTNEKDCNIVTVYTAQAGEEVQEHDDEVTGVLWVPPHDLPPRERVAFGHYAIIGMWLGHQERPFDGLPIVPSGMSAEELFLPSWNAA